MTLNPKAVQIANAKLWAQFPESKGRQLTMAPADLKYRHAWMAEYNSALQNLPKPPLPAFTPVPTSKPTAPVIACTSVSPCPLNIANWTHEQKMEAAIKQANLPDEIMAELPDIKLLAASMVVIGGGLVALASTGYGAVAEGVAAALILVGGYFSGKQIGEGILSLVDFYQKTQCNKAKTQADITSAGASFGDATAKMGVGGLMLLLSALGAKKISIPRLNLLTSVRGVLSENYASVGEMTVPVKNTSLLEALNATSKGEWVKVYEAGKLNGQNVEVHYFRNTTTQQVYDVKVKYEYWHQKEFKNLQQ